MKEMERAYQERLRQNGLCQNCESPEAVIEYEPSEDGRIKKCGLCGEWLGGV